MAQALLVQMPQIQPQQERVVLVPRILLLERLQHIVEAEVVPLAAVALLEVLAAEERVLLLAQEQELLALQILAVVEEQVILPLVVMVVQVS